MAEPGGTVVVVGSVNIDHVVEADAFPAPGETILGTAVRSGVGGKGANQAVAAALAGARVSMVACVGDDDSGQSALAALTRRGVDVGAVRTATDRPTGTAWITVAEHDNTIVVVPGANEEWPTDWPTGDPAAMRALEAADVVLAQLEVPIAVVRAVAAAHRGRFVLNAAPAAVLPDSLLQACDVLVVNEHELATMARAVDHDLRDGSSIDAVAVTHEALRTRGVGAVVTTLGARGAVLTDEHGTTAVPSPPAQVVDTTGAGDAFTGVLGARLAADAPLIDAVRWAAVAGSLAVRAAGTHDSYPDAAVLAAALDLAEAT